jgi:tetratricopeptide (TPR) repeat protein
MSTTVVAHGKIAQADLDRILNLYDRGLCLQAYAAAQAMAPLQKWTGAAARVLAGRLAGNLGAPRLASWHFLRAWRSDPTHPDACWYYARQILDRRGPLAAWNFMKRRGELAGASVESRSHWLSLHACVLGRLRDFDAAETWLARAETLAPDHPWILMERAALLVLEDRHEDALAVARKSLVLRPWYRPGVQETAYLLVQLERDQEALELLTEASQRIENGTVFAQLAALQTELGRHGDARQSYERFAELSPLLEKEFAQWLNARRADCAYYCGDRDKAVEFARQVPGPFFEQIAQRLANPPEGARRVVLPVGFVRQHHLTCAPATLAAISRFWDMPAEHLEVAAAICYDGTPHHSERHWAETNGWVAREFRVTWDSAVALLDRGIPFTLTTPETASSHLQAVIGYDGIRGTLIIRDPGERHQAEFTDGLFKRYASSGPRGMALVPLARADLLTTLDLPDADLYDQMHRLQRALQVHDRHEAEDAYAVLAGLAADHRLTIEARRSLAVYDADVAEMLACTERLLAQFPEDVPLRLAKVACLRDLARRDERVALLKALCEGPASDPVCWQEYAQELAVDAREHPTALHLLRRALRRTPYNAGTHATLAGILWNRRRFADALEVDRFAACLEDKDERLARTYFTTARGINKTEEPLRFLRSRFQRFGKKSSQPARTLSWALDELDRTTEAMTVLDEALKLRPEDGDLLLHAAEVHTNHGDFDRAANLLAAADGHTQRTRWRRAAANLASARGDLVAALDVWQDVLEAEPLAQDAHRAVAQLLAETLSRTAALKHLQGACTKFPHHFALHRLWLEWLQEDGAAVVEPVVRKLIAIHPADSWARRELALTLADLGRLDEAFTELEVAHGLEPANPSYWSVRGRLCSLAGKLPEAQAANREAIRLSVDFDFAIRALLASCDNLAQRREALAFVEQELIRQVILGDGLLSYRDVAQYTLPPEELLTSLRAGLAARPDLWHAWSAVIRQLADMHQLDDALVLARQAVARFPLRPALWFDLAMVYAAGKDDDSSIEALLRALQICPGWSPALRQLADTYERQGRLDEAKTLLERAVARAPLIASNHAALARTLWQRGEREEAIERVRQALLLDPGVEWAWNMLHDWAAKLNRPQLAVDFARDLTARRPGEARSWLMMARALGTAESRDECLAALDRAIALNPRCAEAYDRKAEVLAQAHRYEEAYAACQPALWPEPPLLLRARAAWIDAAQGNLPGAIQAMRDVLAADPNYYWAWRQLADWYQATAAWNDYLHAAHELLRLAPEDASALAYQGEARVRIGDRAGGKADLRRALELSPNYAFAGMTLFDEQLADNELDAAEQTLEAMKEPIGGDYLLAREVQLLAKRGKEFLAAEGLKQLCASTGNATWPLDTAVSAMVQAGWGATAEQFLKAAVAEETFNPHVACLWTERWRPQSASERDERLAALGRALAQAPDNHRACDLQAELLAQSGRFDEAVAACRPSGGEVAPVFLRGRIAWIEAERGDVPRAIEQMRPLVTEDPSYFWGWQQLAYWYERTGDNAGFLDAAERLVALAPDDPASHSFRADARMHHGDRAGAMADYRRAIDLSPDYTYAGTRLLDELMTDGDLEESARTLERLRGHGDRVPLLSSEVRLEAARCHHDPALHAMAELCADPQVAPGMLERAFAALLDAGWAGDAAALVGKALEAPNVNREVGSAWVRQCVARGNTSYTQYLDDLAGRGEAGRRTLVAHAVALGNAKKRRPLLGWMRTYRDLFREDTWGWGTIGYALSLADADHAVVAWMPDWAAHADAEPWMLINLVLALRGLGRLAEARRVGEHTLKVLRPDYTTPYHEVWLTLDEAVDGDTAAAAQRLAAMDQRKLDDYYQVIRTLAECVLQVRQASPPERGGAFNEARRRLLALAARSEPIQHDRALRAAYRRCVRRLAADRGGLKAALWGWRRRLLPLLPRAAKPAGS